jgi:hypothetical protein
LAWWSFPVIPKANVKIIQQIIAERLKNVLDHNQHSPTNIQRSPMQKMGSAPQFIHEAPLLF